MSKTLKMSIVMIIITLGFLFLTQTEVSAVEVNSASAFSEALNGSDKTIVLSEDIELTEGADIVELGGGDYVLNLNGHKLTATEIYINDGSLIINDSTGEGRLNSIFFMVSEGAKAEINNGIFSNGNLELINNEGTLTINNGKFHSIWNMGILTINGGSFANIANDEGKLFINGGTFTSYKHKDEEGEIEYISMFNIINSSIVITGGEFKAEGIKEALRIYGNKELDVGESSINDLIGEGYLAKNEVMGSTKWEVSYSSLEIIKDESTAILNKIAPNGVWNINGAKPKDVDESESMLTSIAKDIELPEGYEIQAWCVGGDKIDPETVHINILYKGIILLEKDIKAVYKEPSKAVMDKVAPVISKIADKIDEEYLMQTGFMLEDLYLINYLNSTKDGIDNSLALNFAKDLIKLTNGSNISYKFDFRCGDSGNDLSSSLGGRVIVYYNGVAVGTTHIALNWSHVLYVPTDTANTDEARIAAALKRIEDYLGTKQGISMTVGGTLESITNEKYDWNANNFFDEKTCGTNYYNLTINEKIYKFVISEKDISELEIPKYVGSDVISNISITSDATEIPLDTAVTVEKVISDNIQKALGTNVYAAYEISLYSNAKQRDVTKLNNGKFIVSIPVPEILKDKEITVYYINSNGEKEEYTTTVKDGMVLFETAHFSTYVLAEKITEDINVGNNTDVNNTVENNTTENNIGSNSNIEDKNNNIATGKNPPTGDNILFFIGMLFVGVIGIILIDRSEKNYKIK